MKGKIDESMKSFAVFFCIPEFRYDFEVKARSAEDAANAAARVAVTAIVKNKFWEAEVAEILGYDEN